MTNIFVNGGVGDKRLVLRIRQDHPQARSVMSRAKYTQIEKT
jgi:hypothetical protein